VKKRTRDDAEGSGNVRLSRMNSLLRLSTALAVLALATLGAAPPKNPPNDSGTFKIYQQNQAVGTESFDFIYSGDSVTVYSGTIRLTKPGGSDTVYKEVELMADALDFNLREYQSKLKVGPDLMIRGINLRTDAFTVYREARGLGSGETYERPLGRLFVLDAESYVLFDVICRNLHGRSFKQRPLTIFLLGAKDTTIDVTVTDIGPDTLNWGGRPVTTRRLLIEDPFKNQARLWVSPIGRMLRFEQPSFALRIERVPPPVKPKPSSG